MYPEKQKFLGIIFFIKKDLSALLQISLVILR